MKFGRQDHQLPPCSMCGQIHPPLLVGEATPSWVALEEHSLKLEQFPDHLVRSVHVELQCRITPDEGVAARPCKANMFMVYLHRSLTPEETDRIDTEEMMASGQGVAPYWAEREHGRTRKVFESPCPHRAQLHAVELATRFGCKLDSPLTT